MNQASAGETGEKKHAVLSRELSEFLIELSIAVHRYAMYPPGHPSLKPAVENAIGRLGEIFLDRRTVSIGVANRQLVIEGVATDPRHPVLSDLARRLHQHQLGAISFGVGINAREMEGVLELLAREADKEGEPIGLSPSRIPVWEHAKVYPVGYDQLEMMGSGSAGGEEEGSHMDRATQLWLGLAQSALASDEPVAAAAPPDAKELAAAIEGHRREAAYDQVIVGYLLQLASELKTGESREADKVRRRVSALVNELGDGTLQRLVDMGGNEAQRRRFLLDANQGLAVDAVVKVLRAAAAGGGQTISSSMTRLLSKLATHAEAGTPHMRAQADTALRENVDDLISNWKLADPNPDQYTAVLDAMARSSPLFEMRVEREGQITGSLRVLQLALEVDAWGPTVLTAVADLVHTGQTGTLVQLIDGSPGTKVAAEIRNYLTDPAHLKEALEGTEDEGALEPLIDRMGMDAIPPLLDVLAESDSRSVRRKVFDRLLRMGPEVGERAVDRLADGRWFVLRNMLVLLQRLETLPPHFDPARFIDHPDERVRREAIPLALRKGMAGRDRVVAGALSDPDERTVRMALIELQKDLPETLVPVVVNRVVKSERSPEIRALGARVLGNSRSALALEVLLGLAIEGKSLMGRSKLADKSPMLIASIQTLARAWPADTRAKEAVALALRSKDADVRRAAEAQPAGA